MDGKRRTRFCGEVPVNKARRNELISKSNLLSHKLLIGLLLSLGLLAFCGTVFGHHGAAAWDTKNTITIQGTVTEFRFFNPHVQIFLDSKDEKGDTVHWGCEAADPAMLVRQGWTRTILKPGDRITVTGRPAKNGAKLVELQKLTLANGQEISAKGSAQ
jgi:hypothetical protein